MAASTTPPFLFGMRLDHYPKIRWRPKTVIPAKAGIQRLEQEAAQWHQTG